MSGPLDALYGRGSSKAWEEACTFKGYPKPVITEMDIGDYVRVVSRWDDSEMKIDCFPDRVHYLTLRSDHRGLYGKLVESTSAYFRERGVTHGTCSPTDAKSAGILKRKAPWKPDGKYMRWDF